MYLWPLLFTVFIDSLGFGLVFPIFSPMIIANDAGMCPEWMSLATRGLIFGFLVSGFCIGQFFGGPMLGALSDRIGRKKVLIGSVLLATIGYLGAAVGVIASSLTVLFIARLMGGVAAGNYGVCQSVITDKIEKKDRTRYFALVGMAWGSGFVIGPFIGGRLAPYGYTMPFLAAGLFCIVNLLMLIYRLEETVKTIKEVKVSLWTGMRQFRQAFRTPGLRGLFGVMFLFAFGWGFFTEFSAVFLMRKLGFQVGQIANFYAWVGLWIALCQGLLIRPLIKRFAPDRLLAFALFFLGGLLPTLLLLEGVVQIFWVLPLIAFSQSLIYPNASTLVSNLASEDRQGEVLGMYNSVQWVAIGLSPLFSGSLVALYPHLPMSVGSLCMFGAFALLARLIYVGQQENN